MNNVVLNGKRVQIYCRNHPVSNTWDSFCRRRTIHRGLCDCLIQTHFRDLSLVLVKSNFRIELGKVLLLVDEEIL